MRLKIVDLINPGCFPGGAKQGRLSRLARSCEPRLAIAVDSVRLNDGVATGHRHVDTG